jgi:hypothetical protein
MGEGPYGFSFELRRTTAAAFDPELNSRNAGADMDIDDLSAA